MTLLTKVDAFMTRHRMLQKGARILVGLSGGADSVALLCLLHQMAQKNPELRIFAVHVNHMLRENAVRDEVFSRRLCLEKNIPFIAEQADVTAVSQREHLSLEDAGRQERYRIFRKYQKELSCDAIATAHHRDDAAETVLLRLLRGCGPEGLKGILPVRQDGVIRPLLHVSKAELLAYLEEIEQDYVTDETNFSCDYARNKIRNELLPLLEREYNPAIREALFRLSELAWEDCSCLEKTAEQMWDFTVSDGRIVLDRQRLLQTEPAIRSRLLQKAYRQLTGNQLEYHHVRALEELLQNQTGKRISLPEGVLAETEYQSLLFYQDGEADTAFCYEVQDGFEQHFPKAGFRITACLSEQKAQGKNRLAVPADGVITVRSRRDGDVMRLPGTDGSKKIKDILIDKKIPRSVRDAWPFVTYQGEIVWMAGFYKNEIPQPAKRYYIITIEKTGENR